MKSLILLETVIKSVFLGTVCTKSIRRRIYHNRIRDSFTWAVHRERFYTPHFTAESVWRRANWAQESGLADGWQIIDENSFIKKFHLKVWNTLFCCTSANKMGRFRLASRCIICNACINCIACIAFITCITTWRTEEV